MKSCDQVASPIYDARLTFNLQDSDGTAMNFLLKGKDLFKNISPLNDGKERCTLMIKGTSLEYQPQHEQLSWVFGLPFFKNYYTVFQFSQTGD